MAGAITQLPAHYETAFDGIWREIMAEQKEHRLAGKYLQKNINGNQERFDQMGAQNYALRQVTARAQKSEPSDVPMFSRWVRPRPFDKTTWVDQFDHILLGSLGDPSSPIARNHGIAAARQKDIVGLNALLGTNYTGAQGTTATVLPTTGGPLGTGQVIGVTYGSGSANSGLQLAKLTAASYIMDSNDVPEEGRHFAYAARELNNLITNVDQVNSVLYNDVRALRDGRIRDFMGFEFTRTQLVPFLAGSTTIRTCVAWQKDFLMYGYGEDVMTQIDKLPTQSQAWQIYTCLLLDATRMEEAGVVQVNCDESV
jgi:Phage capsid protein